MLHRLLYNSAQRWGEHAVTCQLKTRDKVLGELWAWADSTTPLVCRLSGPAGTGKTTVAHTIANEYDKRGQLTTTFFLWRKTKSESVADSGRKTQRVLGAPYWRIHRWDQQGEL